MFLEHDPYLLYLTYWLEKQKGENVRKEISPTKGTERKPGPSGKGNAGGSGGKRLAWGAGLIVLALLVILWSQSSSWPW